MKDFKVLSVGGFHFDKHLEQLQKLLNDGWTVLRADTRHSEIVYILTKDKP